MGLLQYSPSSELTVMTRSRGVAVASVHAYRSEWFVAKGLRVEEVEVLARDGVHTLMRSCMALGGAAPRWS